MARTLDVYLHHYLVGSLIQDDTDEIVFEYNADWLDNPNAFSLSHSLPLRKERYSRRECQGFFGGVLPEGDSRQIIAKNLGISPKNDFAMLDQIGGECAGAVTFLRAGKDGPEQNERYLPLTDSELANLLRTLPRRPLLAGEADIRLSLAGAQNKMAVYIAGDQIFIPLGGAVSTHIIKPEIAGFAGVVSNEAFCMELAHAIGLSTARTKTGHTEGMNYLLVERYDRVRSGAQALERLHQEDFCQALGIVSENKYQNEGGPSLEQCFRLVRETSAVPAIDLLSLLDAVIFNFLIGNNDAHGKNFSLLYEAKTGIRTRLAPFYDLLSTACYAELSPRMAMKIGGEYDSEKIYARHFERLAQEAGFGKPMVKRRVLELVAQLLLKLAGIAAERNVNIEVTEQIRARCKRAGERFRT